jgi:hypothetical protein
LTRQLAAARLLIIVLLATASPVRAERAPSAAAVLQAAGGPPGSRALTAAGERVQMADPSGESTTVLDINGSGRMHLHNRLLAGGLILYMAVMLGALVFLDKRRIAAMVILTTGLVVGGLLLFKVFG